MARKAAILSYDNLDQVDTVKRAPLGTRIEIGHDAFVYVQGVTSGALGSVVTFTPVGVTTLIVADSLARVGVLLSVLDATTKYGWAQVRGICTSVKCDTTIVAGAPMFIDGTAGRADDTVVAGDQIAGMYAYTADTSNICSVIMVHDAWVNNAIG